MNFHTDDWIMNRVKEHYAETLDLYPQGQILGIFLQGSQNYGLDYEGSDIDTKCIIIPSLDDIAFNKKPVSTTHVRENNEHIDLKDVRLYFDTFLKQNLNFLEILFTKYKIINPVYYDLWTELESRREDITRMDQIRSVKSMKGIAYEKYHALEHRYPSKVDIIDKYGYDSKQLHHLLRVEEYLARYIGGEKYEDCLIPKEASAAYLRAIKEHNDFFNLEQARELASTSIANIDKMYEYALANIPEGKDEEVEAFIRGIQGKIIKRGIKYDLSFNEQTI